MWQIGLVTIVLVLFFAGGGLYLFFWFRRDKQIHRALQTGGLTTNATVISKRSETRTVHGKGGQRTSRYYYITYQYTTSSATYTHEESVGFSQYDALKEGNTLPVTYLPADPTIVLQPKDVTDTLIPRLETLLVGSAFAAAALTALIGGLLIAHYSNLATANVQLVNATATAVFTAQKARFLPIQQLIEPKLADWQQDKAITAHRLSAADLGLPASTGIIEVDYGYCAAQDFYAFVWLSRTIQSNETELSGFANYHTINMPAYLCHPEHWITYDDNDLGDGWHAVHASEMSASSSSQ